MRRHYFYGGFALAIILLFTVPGSAATPTDKYRVIYSFEGTPNAAYPISLTLDTDGKLYGTGGGGTYGNGTVFELKRTADGWAENVLYSFTGASGDTSPSTGVIFDKAGNLYGLSDGNSDSDLPAYVFKLAPNAQGGWTKSVLFTFNTTVIAPPFGTQSDLVVDSQGNLFGVLPSGPQTGLAFELMPRAKGDWKETTLHNFDGKPDGALPTTAVLDASGNVWGMTMAGGTKQCRFFDVGFGCGTVYELTPDSSGKWTETLLYHFARGGGRAVSPSDGFLLEDDSHIFATTLEGGDGMGAVLELTKSQESWEPHVLYRFLGYPDGEFPVGQLQMNSSGALFGVTYYGGKHAFGILFQLNPSKNEGWNETILHSFAGGNDGWYPDAGVVFDSRGFLYGITLLGGTGTTCGYGCGTVYEVEP